MIQKGTTYTIKSPINTDVQLRRYTLLFSSQQKSAPFLDYCETIYCIYVYVALPTIIIQLQSNKENSYNIPNIFQTISSYEHFKRALCCGLVPCPRKFLVVLLYSMVCALRVHFLGKSD